VAAYLELGAARDELQVAASTRRLDRVTGQWADGNGLRVRVTCWRDLAGGVASSIMVGDPVVVHGQIFTRDWVDSEGTKRTLYEMEALAVGHKPRPGAGTVRPQPARVGEHGRGGIPPCRCGSVARRPSRRSTSGSGWLRMTRWPRWTSPASAAATASATTRRAASTRSPPCGDGGFDPVDLDVTQPVEDSVKTEDEDAEIDSDDSESGEDAADAAESPEPLADAFAAPTPRRRRTPAGV